MEKNYMDRKRNTVQRQIILETIKKINTHPTTEGIYTEIHRGHPSISKTTVYRTLRQLVESGIIRQVSLPDDLERYDCRQDQHYHFKCKKCGGIIDVDIEYLADIDDNVHGKYGFLVDGHDVVFSGYCLKCK